MTPRKQQVLIALGANLPWQGKHPITLVKDALLALDGMGLAVARTSRFFATPCFPAGAGPDYVNAAALLDTDLAAPQVLEALHAVEAVFGRTRATRWGERTLDLDLLAFDDQVRPDLAGWTWWRDLPAQRQTVEAPQTLILPHPRLQDRAFVLVPLMDIAPDWRHPVSGKTVAQMVSALPQAEIDAVRPI